VSDHELPSRPRVSLDEIALFEQLRREARRERAPAYLASQILDRVQDDVRRERLLTLGARPRTAPIAALVLAGLCVAAGVAFVARPRVPPIARELPPAAQHIPEPAPRPDPCANALVASGDAPLIDDFEDGDDAVLPNEQRRGFWRWVRETDAPGTAPALLPIPRPSGGTGARGTSNRLALHVRGGRLSDWGAAIEFSFRPGCYDASRYGGIAFTARGPGRIYVAPREVGVIPVGEGGSCERDCHNAHVLKVDLDNRFRSYEVRFDDVRQRGFNKPPLDAKRLNSLAFLIRPEDTPYDVWIDDVRFTPR
jgi:hypothetical protein